MPETIRTDFHMHSTFSPDGHDTIHQLCRYALEHELTTIAVTDHVEWQPDGRQYAPDFPRYFESLLRCREEFGPQGLRILSGLELGNPHHHMPEVQAVLDAYEFDVVIASLHWLDGENIHNTRIFADRDPYAVYSRYFADLGRMASVAPGNLIAHFDRIFWPGTQVHGALDTARLEPIVRPALEQIAARNWVLELNTRFLAHTPGWNDILQAVLLWFNEAGGAGVAVDSDAHRCKEIGRHRDVGAVLVRAAGFPLLNTLPAPQLAVVR
ncbi:MAG: PHP domain-containing protein [Anaerolineales bacterium]|nr:PHP domain-containing protein [Anaerolineales bacterium]